jgi:hypothetical protein
LSTLAKGKAGLSDIALTNFKEEHKAAFEYGILCPAKGLAHRILTYTRELLNCCGYFGVKYPISTSPHMIKRAMDSLPGILRFVIYNSVVRRVLTSRFAKRLYKITEELIRPDPEITRLLQDLKPDVVVAVPFIFAYSSEVDYVKCAISINTPTVVPVFSWDNLTTKGVFQLLPEYVMIWNKFQVKELTNIHGVPESLALITGAPSLDHWFTRSSKASRTEFCNRNGINPNKPFVVYLCSSWNVAPDEHLFANELVRELPKHLGNDCPTIVIRPHPLNTGIWKEFRHDGVVILPKKTEDFYGEDGKDLFFSSLYYSKCIIGINTTAMIEATIVDKPCLTIMSTRFKTTQMDSHHFHHLRDGKFLHITNTFEELADEIRSVLQGADKKKTERRLFVKEFVKPWTNLTCSDVMASMIELCAQRKSPSIIRDVVAAKDLH